MKSKKILGFLISFLIVEFVGGIFSISYVYAEDYYIEKHTQTVIDGDIADKALVKKLWIQKDRVRVFDSRQNDIFLIILMSEDKVYQINNDKKTVEEINIKSKFGSVQKEMQITSRKTGLKRKINQWETYQVLLTSSVNGRITEVEYWLNDKIGLPLDMRMKIADYFGQRKIMEELNKYPGYPVEIIVHSKVGDARIEQIITLAKLEKKKIEDHLFNLSF